ncbi:penicillin amidase [Aurantiacibacter gangjinensis]|uniref:Penicillin amidase n=1 Tax=Aurantiacibacter gangjinensis TaxID=502682 RepID=A0A0G9MSL0_9SPHN|nr:penicillin amidase [Aurantiacibacter gangjinensis]
MGLVVLLVLVAIALMVWEPLAARPGEAPTAGRIYEAEIVRDDFGVPHIYGATDADVAFGVAIAHAEDDFSTLQDVIAMARGRYGAIAGEEGAQVDYAYHLLDARGTAERQFTRLPEDTQELFNAYAVGLNQFAEENAGEVKLRNLFPVNGEDVAAGFALRQPFFFGLNNTIGPLVDSEDRNPEPGPPLAALPLHMGEDGEHAGSNAFAIAPEKSGDDVTRLVSNSHQPLRGGVAWYELVVQSEEGWHFAGANFPGSPFPFLGHNPDLGWTNTVNVPDMVDVYELTVDEAGENYLLDGEWLPLESRRVWLGVAMGPFDLPVPQTVYRSVHGPVVKNDDGYFAIRYGGIDNLDNLDAYYRLNKAGSLEEFRAILARMDIPSTNFVYADAEGNIGYFYNAAIPDRVEGPDWRGVLPGDRSDLIWQGPVAFEELPQIVNPESGWLFNANNTPFSAAGEGSDLDPAEYSPVLGIETRSTNRARRAARLMSLPGVIDRGRLEEIKYDTAYDREGYVAAMLDSVAALELEDGTLLHRAQGLLGGWDLDADGDGGADALALLMIRPFMRADYQSGEIPDAREELERSAEHLMEHFGRLDPPLGDVLRLRQGDVDLPLDGGSDTLRASTLWDIDEDGRLSLRHGDSFIQFVEWAPGERVRSQSIQPFGAATTRPESPHYTDQMQLFVDHELKPVWFWREDVLANASRRYSVRSAAQ